MDDYKQNNNCFLIAKKKKNWWLFKLVLSAFQKANNFPHVSYRRSLFPTPIPSLLFPLLLTFLPNRRILNYILVVKGYIFWHHLQTNYCIVRHLALSVEMSWRASVYRLLRVIPVGK